MTVWFYSRIWNEPLCALEAIFHYMLRSYFLIGLSKTETVQPHQQDQFRNALES